MEYNIIEEKFTGLWYRIRGNGNSEETALNKKGRQELNKLITLYSESHRHYHNLNHIIECIKDFESTTYLAEHPNEVEMAIWYHDSIYSTQFNPRNEEESAKFAYITAQSINLPEAFANRVENLILETKHNKSPKDIDSKVLVDIDLAILGKSEEEFNLYEENIRKEYVWVPEETFKIKRAEILKEFLNRPSIYSTDFFKNKYESQARKNLERSIKNLEQKEL